MEIFRLQGFCRPARRIGRLENSEHREAGTGEEGRERALPSHPARHRFYQRVVKSHRAFEVVMEISGYGFKVPASDAVQKQGELLCRPADSVLVQY